MPLAHLHCDMLVSVEVQLHDDLLNERLVRDARTQLDHLSVLL